MKKIAFTLICFLSIFLISCNGNNNLDLTPTDTEIMEVPTNDQTEALKKHTQLYVEYSTFEHALCYSTDVLLGRCINIVDNVDSIIYEFSVIERFLGENITSNIFVTVEKNQSIHISSSGTFVAEMSDFCEQLPYKVNSEYYLLLSRFVNVYYDHDIYTLHYSAPYIPADNISQSKMYGEPLFNHSDIEQQGTKFEFHNYISKLLASADKTNSLLYYGDAYTTSTDLSTIVREADHVVKVKIQNQVISESTSENENIYQCIVISTLKGNIKKEEVIQVRFFPNTISVGSEYVLAINDSNLNATPKKYKFSSKNSLFQLSEYDKIMEIIKN